jgi:hypothetical protein
MFNFDFFFLFLNKLVLLKYKLYEKNTNKGCRDVIPKGDADKFKFIAHESIER